MVAHALKHAFKHKSGAHDSICCVLTFNIGFGFDALSRHCSLADSCLVSTLFEETKQQIKTNELLNYFEICKVGVRSSHITAGRHSEEEESWAPQHSKQFKIKQLFPTFWAEIRIAFHESLCEAKQWEAGTGLKEDGATSVGVSDALSWNASEKNAKWLLETRREAKIDLHADIACSL